MRFVGMFVLSLVLIAAPFASACGEPRIASCRGPIADFSSFTSVAITSPVLSSSAPEGGSETILAYTITAHTTLRSGPTCVAVHSELHDGGGTTIETIDTPVRATISGGTLTTTSIFHYRAGTPPMTLHVTTLGTTLDAMPIDPRIADAGVVPADAR